jgi:hypothetical protein
MSICNINNHCPSQHHRNARQNNLCLCFRISFLRTNASEEVRWKQHVQTQHNRQHNSGGMYTNILTKTWDCTVSNKKILQF